MLKGNDLALHDRWVYWFTWLWTSFVKARDRLLDRAFWFRAFVTNVAYLTYRLKSHLLLRRFSKKKTWLTGRHSFLHTVLALINILTYFTGSVRALWACWPNVVEIIFINSYCLFRLLKFFLKSLVSVIKSSILIFVDFYASILLSLTLQIKLFKLFLKLAHVNFQSLQLFLPRI
jgi:hypothetical protein